MLTSQNSLSYLDSTHNKRKALLPFDVMFYVVFILIYTFFFLRTTLIYDTFLKDYTPTFIQVLTYLGYFLMGYSIFTIMFVCDGIKSRVVSIAMLAFALFYLYKRELTSDYKTIFMTFMLVLCSRGKNPKILLWSTYIIGWFLIVLSFVFSITDVVPYYIYSPGRRGFGSVYPTDLACHILILGITLGILKDGKLKLYDYAWYLIVCIVNLIFMKAKVGLICLLFVLLGAAFKQYVIPNIKIPKVFLKIFKFAAVVCYPLLAVLAIVLSKTYVDTPNNFWSHFKTIRLRLLYGSQAFQQYDVKFWGTWFKEIGNGGVPAPHPDYFYIDVSYVRVLFFNGIITLFLVLLIYTISQFTFINKEMYFVAFTFIIFSIDCVIEHHIIQIPYGMVLMCVVFSEYVKLYKPTKIRKPKSEYVFRSKFYSSSRVTK